MLELGPALARKAACLTWSDFVSAISQHINNTFSVCQPGLSVVSDKENQRLRQPKTPCRPQKSVRVPSATPINHFNFSNLAFCSIPVDTLFNTFVLPSIFLSSSSRRVALIHFE